MNDKVFSVIQPIMATAVATNRNSKIIGFIQYKNPNQILYSDTNCRLMNIMTNTRMGGGDNLISSITNVVFTPLEPLPFFSEEDEPIDNLYIGYTGFGLFIKPICVSQSYEQANRLVEQGQIPFIKKIKTIIYTSKVEKIPKIIEYANDTEHIDSDCIDDFVESHYKEWMEFDFKIDN